jgi:methylase of polypeptide subunit release factors
VLEVAAGAGERVERLLSELGFGDVAITPDLAGRDRVAEGRWTAGCDGNAAWRPVHAVRP